MKLSGAVVTAILAFSGSTLAEPQSQGPNNLQKREARPLLGGGGGFAQRFGGGGGRAGGGRGGGLAQRLGGLAGGRGGRGGGQGGLAQRLSELAAARGGGGGGGLGAFGGNADEEEEEEEEAQEEEQQEQEGNNAEEEEEAEAPPPAAGDAEFDGGPSAFEGGAEANDIADDNGCRPATVIFARGTTEPGNMGLISGPPMVEALQAQLGQEAVSVQGVDYPASIAGNINQGEDGGPEMAALVEQTLQQCPGTQIILSGYSQGAMVVHNAVEEQGVDVAVVAAVVLFGDPLLDQPVGDVPEAQIQQFCADGDAVCEGGGFAITPAHLSYGDNAEEAAQFIVDTAGLQ